MKILSSALNPNFFYMSVKYKLQRNQFHSLEPLVETLKPLVCLMDTPSNTTNVTTFTTGAYT